MKAIIETFILFVIGYFAIANTFYLLIIFLGFLNSRKRMAAVLAGMHKRLVDLRKLPGISILIPCHNEEKVVFESIASALSLDYPDYEIIVINDGSSDNTLQKILKAFPATRIKHEPPRDLPSLNPKAVYQAKNQSNLLIIDKPNGGKSDALNCGINFASQDLVCCIDSDSHIDSMALQRVCTPFLQDPDNTIAAGGAIFPLTGRGKNSKSKIDFNWYTMIQTVEYLRAFLVGRMGWDFLRANTIISGAFGIFRRENVIKSGGYRTSTIGEDMDLLLRMQVYSQQSNGRSRICILPDPICWTESPTDFATLRNQRIRWAHGLIDSLWHNRSLCCRFPFSFLGWVAFPYLVFFELLSAPFEILGFIAAIWLMASGNPDIWMIISLFLVTIVYGVFLNLLALISDLFSFQTFIQWRDCIKLCIGSVLEQIGYRSFNYSGE